MKYLKVIGFGVLVWGVAFLMASLFLNLGIGDSLLARSLTGAAFLLTAFLLAKNLDLSGAKEALIVGAVWVVLDLLLSYLLVSRFTGPEFFRQARLWLSCLLLLLTPVVAAQKS